MTDPSQIVVCRKWFQSVEKKTFATLEKDRDLDKQKPTHVTQALFKLSEPMCSEIDSCKGEVSCQNNS